MEEKFQRFSNNSIKFGTTKKQTEKNGTTNLDVSATHQYLTAEKT